ncbi:hypothetical protein DL98DRAFT_525718 [Cadophora sp. DSE1049]|nr:hypothetical protein DL98DRAFT_525718 [Cadophora sp. DSE1049]
MRPHRNTLHPRAPLHKALPRLAPRDIAKRASQRLPQHDAALSDKESFVCEMQRPSAAACEERVLWELGEEQHDGCEIGCGWEGTGRSGDAAYSGDHQKERRVVERGGKAGGEETEEGRGDREIEETERLLTKEPKTFPLLILPFVTKQWALICNETYNLSDGALTGSQYAFSVLISDYHNFRVGLLVATREE